MERFLQAGKKKEKEELIQDFNFSIHKFNNRKKPSDKRRILFLSCFSEFGCEIIGCMYCIPRLLQIFSPATYYVIAVGWHGRAYLYKHLVDEFWEIDEKHQWLRDYCRAFHNVSINLKKLESELKNSGVVISANFIGSIAVGNICNNCRNFWGDLNKPSECPKCKSNRIVSAILSDVAFYKPQAVKILKPGPAKMIQARKYLGKNPVAIFARNRKTYGRNLQKEFYLKLINLLEKKGYTPIWMGEKHNTLPCPVDHIVDMSSKPESRDLELTLAIIANLKFTVQFWTASTRLAAMMETPYLLFESPDQIYGPVGQEGMRINLVTTGNKKICISHFLNVYNNNDEGIDLVNRCVSEMENNNWDTIIGMVDNPKAVEILRQERASKIGGMI